MQSELPQAIILSGASGAGKTTLAQHLLQCYNQLQFSVSACTRLPRPQEVDGKDYYFLSAAEFSICIAQDALLEWEEVYPNHYYGTLREKIAKIWADRQVPLFDIDANGALKLKQQFRERALAIFIQVPTMSTLVERLKARGESADAIAMRSSKATQEMALANQFDITLVNEDLATSLQRIQQLAGNFLGGVPPSQLH